MLQITDNFRNINLDSVVKVLIFLFPLSLLTYKSLGDIVLFFIFIIGLYELATKKIHLFINKNVLAIAFITLVYFFNIILSIFMSEKGHDLLHFAARELYFLFAVFIAATINSHRIGLDTMIMSIRLSIVVFGLYIVYQFFSVRFGQIEWVISLGTSPLIITLFFAISICNVKVKDRFFLLYISSALALSVIIISQERMAFLAMLLFSLLFAFVYKDKRIYVYIFAMLVSILASTDFRDRMVMAYDTVTEYSVNNNIVNKAKNATYSTTFQRIEMYKSGLQAAKDSIIFGHGYRNTNEPASEYVSDPVLKEIISKYNHLHNLFLNTMVYGGVFGILSLLLLLLVPTVIFVKQRRENKDYAYSGIILISSYCIFGLTGTILGDVFFNSVFVFFLSFFLTGKPN